MKTKVGEVTESKVLLKYKGTHFQLSSSKMASCTLVLGGSRGSGSKQRSDGRLSRGALFGGPPQATQGLFDIVREPSVCPLQHILWPSFSAHPCLTTPVKTHGSIDTLSVHFQCFSISHHILL